MRADLPAGAAAAVAAAADDPGAGRVRVLTASSTDPFAGDGPNVIANMRRTPKKIAAMYVYDETGTRLFERQCGTPEYYLRRVEARLLREHALEILERCGYPALVELGTGTAEKSQILIGEYAKAGLRCDFYPIDVDTQTLIGAARRLVARFACLHVHCLGTNYETGLGALTPCTGSRLFLFLGSSLGNMEYGEMEALLGELFRCGSPGDFLLLGADLDKDPAVIHAAYNDSAGYGPRSTLNMLSHLNHRYAGDFVLENFRYRSSYRPHLRKNEVSIESRVRQSVTLAALDFTLFLEEGESIDAEVMWKFDPDELLALLKRAGFPCVEQWIEPVHRYGLFLLRRQ